MNTTKADELFIKRGFVKTFSIEYPWYRYSKKISQVNEVEVIFWVNDQTYQVIVNGVSSGNVDMDLHTIIDAWLKEKGWI